MDKLGDWAIKIVAIGYLAMAFLVGIERAKAAGGVHGGTIWTIITGLDWGIVLLARAIVGS